MIARRIRRVGIRIVLLGILFAQAAVAANACLTPGSMRAAPCATGAAPTHCQQPDEISSNLCFYQWADQSGQSMTPPVVAASIAAVLTVADAAQCLLPWTSPVVGDSPGHDPPIPIRFCSFLI